ncbi:[FeFe] hydrogenase H-cluster maturation GTPase HydF [Marispirochaeta aestuarii]|uniref:[FeFe] hydrogenase H-cluster maturation GTPase HydF n=1 Tax=Marispirochaeta aestuarii TaxID=1963862 RepID=UPI002ABD9556|nr:[FeFe] hydrogenase H-cluster maturation GTPase HydF [Marispirochaeta aestuarii]
MKSTPLAEQSRIVLLGIRNAGKSSLMNALFGKKVAIVSRQPGTTTDPVTRSFEVPGLGPAAIVDTAGIDDEGELGALRIKAAMERIRSADMVIMVSPGQLSPTEAEEQLYSRLFGQEAETGKVPALLVLTRGRENLDEKKRSWLESTGGFRVENPEAKGIAELIAAIGKIAPAAEPTPLEGLVSEGDLILLVTPIDLAAPKGRLILPQVETLRDALDRDCASLVVKERELFRFYQDLKEPPKLVITDSQAFHKVAADIPEDQPLTSFSILFARKKGELDRYDPGLAALEKMKPAPRILMLESCSHHRQADDIGTVKIPRLFRQMVRRDAEFIFSRRMPEKDELKDLDLVIMCASCMLTRTKVMTRLDAFRDAGVPVLNYGLFLAWANGLFPRALEPLKQ